MTTVALVHGGWHGAWCWERVAPALEERGHCAVTMDLPCDDPTADLDTYADTVCEALDGVGDDVVVVGHSMGGLTIPLVAARRPVRHLIYLCALLPAIGRSFFDQLADEPEMMCPGWNTGLSDTDSQGRTTWTTARLAREFLFADCDDATVQSAFDRLRPQVGVGAIPFALSEFPSARATSVICSDDRMVAADWSERTARDRLGADVITLPGSHSPFLSRPEAVAGILAAIAENP